MTKNAVNKKMDATLKRTTFLDVQLCFSIPKDLFLIKVLKMDFVFSSTSKRKIARTYAEDVDYTLTVALNFYILTRKM